MDLRRTYKRSCHTPVLRPFVHFGKALNRYYENLNYDHRTNGELRVLRVLSGFSPEVVLDVGANTGDWVTLASQELPTAEFFCFEPGPGTFEELRKLESPSLHPFNVALGPSRGAAHLNYYVERHAFSSMYRFDPHGEEPTETPVDMISGDEFLAEHGLELVDFLKIDTEGFDLQVLKGFEGGLERGRIKSIQFEYGRINIVSKALLYDFYELLGGYGYTIGKVYPRSVTFCDYDYDMEDFLGPNFIAVQSDEKELIGRLR